MTFRPNDFPNFIADAGVTESRLFPQLAPSNPNFDIVIVGSGMGGGVLADALADGFGVRKRILVLEAGSYLFPTHVYNVCRFPNATIARHFGCKNFWQPGSGGKFFIGEEPQMNFGGRSIFWSGLIPQIQPWELEFFPQRVRDALDGQKYLQRAGDMMNESRSMGTIAADIVKKLQATPLAQDFDIRETPRALHQPYLTAEGTPTGKYFFEPTGVFNTAELLINQAGIARGRNHDEPGLHVLLNRYVEDVQQKSDRTFELVTRNTLTGEAQHFHAGTLVLAGGSIESPKLLQRSTLFRTSVPDHVKPLVGRGLTDHPTSHEMTSFVTGIGGVDIPKDAHAKIIFYSRGRRENGQILFPFNVEMNVNHEYWHLRENDPSSPQQPVHQGNRSRLDIKFSYGNCLDDGNEIKPAPAFQYVPEIVFRNQEWTDHLAGSRFPALAGWQKSDTQIFDVMNDITRRIFREFSDGGAAAKPDNDMRFGSDNKGFGYGTVHHAIGTLRMPYRPTLTSDFNRPSVVDEDLRVAGTDHMYVCDMSVMPFSSAANPVRTLVALALRMAKHFGA